jgi:hypothetical protein
LKILDSVSSIGIQTMSVCTVTKIISEILDIPTFENEI